MGFGRGEVLSPPIVLKILKLGMALDGRRDFMSFMVA